jgi:hypothetical protein
LARVDRRGRKLGLVDGAQQVITGPADAFPLVQPVDAQECVSHLADLLRELQQPDLDGNLPVVGVQLSDLIPHQFLPEPGMPI